MLLSDPHRHSQDDSWVFGAAAKGDRGKVDRADRTVDMGRSTVPSAKTLHAHGWAGFGWLGSSCRTASIWPPFWQIRLPFTFAHLWGRHSEMASPWSNKHTSEARRHVSVYKDIPDHFCHPFQSSTLYPITFNQGSDSLTVARSLCLSILPWSVLTCPLLQCLFFFFLSLCRFTLTYQELILLFLSFNKLLSKRWDSLPWFTHHLSP